MLPEPNPSETPAAAVAAAPVNAFAAADVAAILRERGWIAAEREIEAGSALEAWCAKAAELLGPQASERAALGELLSLVFTYSAADSLQQTANQDVLARSGAREVIRELANRVLDGGDLDSDRFKEIVEGIKAAVPYRSREMFHPIRLALTGRAGEGDLDRVILLLDAAAKLDFAAPVKGARQRMLEFCAALD
jgi:nondiscriminating glutamyl-tRNA synthetase